MEIQGKGVFVQNLVTWKWVSSGKRTTTVVSRCFIRQIGKSLSDTVCQRFLYFNQMFSNVCSKVFEKLSTAQLDGD